MSIKFIRAVLEHDHAPRDPGQRLVLVVLAYHAHDDGSEARPGMKLLSERAAMPERTVRRHLAALRAAGWVVRDRPHAPGRVAVWRVLPTPQPPPGAPEQRPAVAPVERRQRPNRTVTAAKSSSNSGQIAYGTAATPRSSNRHEPSGTVKKKDIGGERVDHVTPEVLPGLAPNGASSAPAPTAVGQVFEAWAATMKNPGAVKFTDQRRRLIARRLKDYPLADLLDAVQGWQHDPWNRGENPDGKTYADLGLILRDAAHVEKFRDLWRNGPPRPGARDRNTQIARARIEARHAGQLPRGF